MVTIYKIMNLLSVTKYQKSNWFTIIHSFKKKKTVLSPAYSYSYQFNLLSVIFTLLSLEIKPKGNRKTHDS